MYAIRINGNGKAILRQKRDILEEKLNRLKSQPSGFDWKQQFSWERDIWIPKETKHPFTPDRFIEFATNAINATNNSIKLITKLNF